MGEETGFTNQVENLIQSTLTLLKQQKNLKQSITEKEDVPTPLLRTINEKIDKLNIAASNLEKTFLKKDDDSASLTDHSLYTQLKQAIERSKQARKDKPPLSYKEKTAPTESSDLNTQVPKQLKNALKTRKKKIRKAKASGPEESTDNKTSLKAPFPSPCGSESEVIIKFRKQIHEALEERKKLLEQEIDNE